MQNYTFVSTVIAVAIASIIVGCSNGNDPIFNPNPSGNWIRETVTTEGEVQRNIVSRLELGGDPFSYITDSVLVFENGIWQLDSLAITQLQLAGVGDGYQRSIEVRLNAADSTPIDTTLRYRYFYMKDDSLYFYQGSRLTGISAGIVGTWNTLQTDDVFHGERLTLTVDPDSINIRRETLSSDILSNLTFAYSTKNDTLKILGGPPFPYGNRYEVVPGFSLYITSHAERGYARK